MSETPRGEQPEEFEQEPKIEITEYSGQYKEQIVRLINDVYENEIGQHSESGRPDLDKISEVYQKENGNFWVALDGEKVIGTIGLINQGEQRASLHRFCVAKRFRGKGVSNRLFSTFLGFAYDKDYEKIFLSTWAGAKAANKFYTKNGFKRIEFLPEDLSHRSYFVHDKVFYGLDLKEVNKEKQNKV